MNVPSLNFNLGETIDALRDTLGMPRAEAFTRLANPQPLPGVTSTAEPNRIAWMSWASCRIFVPRSSAAA